MNMKRMRGRGHRPSGGGGGSGGGGFRNQQNGIPLNRNHVFDSSGPEMRVRGTAQQLYEKYTQLARDASSSGDRVTGEAYYQHAEHYFRIINAINQAQGQTGSQPAGQGQERGNYQPQLNGGEARSEYPRRNYAGNDLNETQGEPRQEPRSQESRPQERRFEQRQFEPRPRPEFQRPERNEHSEQHFRPEPAADTRIDISSALEAELVAASGEPAGFGDQSVVQQAALTLEPRSIQIISDAPPPAEAAPKTPRPRGRPRQAKASVKTEE